MPYEEISEAKYNELIQKVRRVDFSPIVPKESYPEKFCDSSTCAVDVEGQNEHKLAKME